MENVFTFLTDFVEYGELLQDDSFADTGKYLSNCRSILIFYTSELYNEDSFYIAIFNIKTEDEKMYSRLEGTQR